MPEQPDQTAVKTVGSRNARTAGPNGRQNGRSKMSEQPDQTGVKTVGSGNAPISDKTDEVKQTQSLFGHWTERGPQILSFLKLLYNFYLYLRFM